MPCSMALLFQIFTYYSHVWRFGFCMLKWGMGKNEGKWFESCTKLLVLVLLMASRWCINAMLLLLLIIKDACVLHFFFFLSFYYFPFQNGFLLNRNCNTLNCMYVSGDANKYQRPEYHGLFYSIKWRQWSSPLLNVPAWTNKTAHS